MGCRRTAENCSAALAYDPGVSRRPLITAVSLLFLVSGVSSLIFETAWTRLFLGLFGHGIHSTSAVLAAFMGGLGLGALVAGRKASGLSRPLKVYALLELAIGAWVATSVLQVRAADLAAGVILAHSGSPAAADAVAWVVAFGLLLVPSSLMGATLPILCRALISEEAAIGRVFGLLYGINTLGAVVGVVGTGFWLIRYWGVHTSLWLGCGLNLVAAVGALWIDRSAGAAPDREVQSLGDPVDEGGVGWVVIVVAVAGWCAMAFEVVWIRLFVFILGSSILSLSTVLGTLLLAMALGSVLLPRLVRERRRHLWALGWSQLILGVSAVGGLMMMERLQGLLDVVSTLIGGGAPLGAGSGRVLVVAAVIFIPGLAMGATLPAATGVISDLRSAERGIGRLYAANTLGNILGALGAGYLLVPVLGAARAMIMLAAVNLLVAAWVFLRTAAGGSVRRWLPVAVVVLAVVGVGAVLDGDGLQTVFSDRKSYGRLIEVSEGLRGTVTVQDIPPLPILAANVDKQGLFSVGAGYRLLAVDGVDVAGSSPDLRTTQKMQAHIPLLLHGSPRRILQIGHGSGSTALEVGFYRPEVFDLVEINPRVIEEAHRWFPQWAGGQFEAIFTDAKNFVRRTSRQYDVILNDSTYPGHAGSSQLYSADHFQACRDRLAPGGIVSTWLPVDLPPESFAMVLASFRSVFPEVEFWLPLNCWNKHGVLVGSLEKLEPRLERLRWGRWPEGVAESLATIGLNDPDVFASSMMLNTGGVETLATGARLNSDDRPYLEYPARGWVVSGERFWSQTLEEIRKRTSATTTHEKAVDSLIEGQLLLLGGDADAALERYARAQDLWPGHSGPAKLREDILMFRAQAGLQSLEGSSVPSIERLQDIVRQCPFSARAHFELGRALFEGRRYEEAISHLEVAAEDGQGLDRAWLFLGDIWALAGRPAEAEHCYRQYLGLNPPALEILAALGDVVAEQGRPAEARSIYKQADALSPGSEMIAERLKAVGR